MCWTWAQQGAWHKTEWLLQDETEWNLSFPEIRSPNVTRHGEIKVIWGSQLWCKSQKTHKTISQRSTQRENVTFLFRFAGLCSSVVELACFWKTWYSDILWYSWISSVCAPGRYVSLRIITCFSLNSLGWSNNCNGRLSSGGPSNSPARAMCSWCECSKGSVNARSTLLIAILI